MVNWLRRRTPAQLLRDYHLIATGFWMVMIPVSIITGLWHSLAFITLISLWALVSTEWGAWQGSRAEVMAEQVKVEAEDAHVSAGSVTVEEQHAV